MSSPKGHCKYCLRVCFILLIPGQGVVHISMPLLEEASDERSPAELLRPFLDATLSLCQSSATEAESASSVQPLFSLFYKQHPHPTSSNAPEDPAPLLPQTPESVHLPEVADSMVGSAEATFWCAVEQLKAAGRKPQHKAEEDGHESQGASEISSVWPPLEYVEEEGEEW